jgi:hypothetical protein
VLPCPRPTHDYAATRGLGAKNPAQVKRIMLELMDQVTNMDSEPNSLDPSTLFLADSEMDAMVTTNDMTTMGPIRRNHPHRRNSTKASITA